VDSDSANFIDAILESESTVGRWLPWFHKGYDENEAKTFFAARRSGIEAGSDFGLGIFSNSDDRFLGGVGVRVTDPLNRQGAIGYWVRQSAQQQGIGAEAAKRIVRFGFEALDLIRIEVVVGVGNTASARIAAACGGRLDAVIEQRIILHGKPQPAQVFSIIRPGNGES